MPCANAKNYSINFNGEKYSLLYSVKNPDFGGYLNEYFKRGETYNIWSEMVAVHHFPNAYSPIDRIKDFKEYLSSMHVPSSLTFDDKKNTAIIDFIMIADQKLPVVMEFNIFKYEKSKKSGSVAVQYTKRYAATTTMQIEEIKKSFEKERKKMLKVVNNYKIPAVVTEDIDKCISGLEVNKQISNEKVNEGEINNIKDEPVNDELKLTAPDTINSEAESLNSDSLNDDKNHIIDNQNDDSIKDDESTVSNECDENSSEDNKKEEKSDINNDENVKNDDELNVNNNKLNEEKREEIEIKKVNSEEITEPEGETNIKQEINKTELQQNSKDVNDKKLHANDNKAQANRDEVTEKENPNENISNSKENVADDSNEKNAVNKKSADNENKADVSESNFNGVRQIVTNDKSEYIAKPRTKKEMKKYVKNKKALNKAKARVKEVEKRLAE